MCVRVLRACLCVRVFSLCADGLPFSVRTPPHFLVRQNAVEIYKSGKELYTVNIESRHLKCHLPLFRENGTLFNDASIKPFIF